MDEEGTAPADELDDENFGEGPRSRRTAEVGAGIVKAAVSSIPIIGGAGAELLDLVIGPTLEKRRDEWFRELGEVVEELRERLDGFDPGDLQGNEQFVSAVVAASTVAVKTHQREKLIMLKNALVHAALPGAPDEHEQMLFIRYIDELTPLHVRVLAFIADPGGWFDKHELEKPRFMMAGLSTILETGLPELAGRREVYDLAVADLDQRRLTDASSALHTSMTNEGVWAPRITAAGMSLASVMGPPFRQWHGTTPGATSVDPGMMNDAAVAVKNLRLVVMRRRSRREHVRG